MTQRAGVARFKGGEVVILDRCGQNGTIGQDPDLKMHENRESMKIWGMLERQKIATFENLCVKWKRMGKCGKGS